MAESAVSFLIEYLGPFLVDEVKLLKGVRGEARRIRDELQSMRAFLRDADAKEDSNESIKEWVRQVRHAAYDVEDIVDDFILHIGQYQQDGRAVFGFLRKMACSIKQLKARHRVGKQMQDMRSRLSEISKRKDDYNLNRTERKDGVYDPRMAALFTEESELVGIDEPRAQLIGWLLNGEQRLSTMSVVGMGGLGKTTLVKKVYDSEHVKKHFAAYAWITVSETFKKTDLLQDMIKQLYQAKHEQAPSGVDGMTDIQLIQLLRDYLQNERFVIVFDDLWEVDAWKFLSLSMPAREDGSRVILTMRRHDIASSCCVGPSDYIYELQPLNQDMAWSLFCRRSFPKNKENRCPTGLEPLAESFVKKCRGLPLAIVTLGGLLASKDQTPAAWEMIHTSLGSELGSDNQLKSMMEILWLSFNDLPYYLKSCFSYLSIFPEDHKIGHNQIIQLWMAEGFIEKKEGRTPEEVGESYLNALLSRSLIQVTNSVIGAKVLAFRIHDLLREIIISKSGEENLIVSSGEEKIAVSEGARRLAIYSKGEVVKNCESSSHLRSFFIFGMKKPSITSAFSSFAGFRLLRVVNIENVPMESFPEDLTSLLHLRYLCVYGAKIKHLPSSVGKLINLETLILQDCFVCELPVEICKLQRLRHLFVSRQLEVIGPTFHLMDGAKVPSGVGSLRSLQELRCVQVEGGVVGELGNLPQLRMLGIVNLRREYGNDLCTSVEKMSQLETLEIKSVEENEEIDLHSLSYPPQTLQRLILYGHLKKLPDWIADLQNLLVLRLRFCGLKEDPLKALGSLPNLVELRMRNAYDGEDLCVKEGEYPKLRELWLNDLRGLKKVTVEKGAMPNVEVLVIRRCKLLAEIPFWLEHLTNLRELSLADMPVTFLESLHKDGVERVDLIQHIPLIDYYDSQTGKTWKF